MSSTQRGGVRHTSDYYVTPIAEIVVFLSEAIKYIPNLLHGKILDPCAGGDNLNLMSYPTALQQFGVNQEDVTTIDIRDDSRALICADYLKTHYSDIFDLVITNPPFSHAQKIIMKGLADVKVGGYVVILLRLNFFGAQKRFQFWQDYLPIYTFVHNRRMSFTSSGTTDSIEYMHTVWQKGNYPEFTKLKVI